MKMNLNEYLNARLIILSAEFEDIKEEKDKDERALTRLIAKCDELTILSNLVEEAESSYKNFFTTLSDSIREWRGKIK